MRVLGFVLACVSSFLLLEPGHSRATAPLDDEPEPEEPEEPEKPEKEEEPEAEEREFTEREKRILALFTASSATFDEKGRLVLCYDFETEKEELVEDWRPGLAETKQRIRWALVAEGPPDGDSTVYGTGSTRRLDGIVIGDFGQWLHKASFLGDVEMEVEVLSMAQPRPGTMVGPVFYNEKKKRGIGVNAGSQVVCMSGLKATRPHPKEERPLTLYRRLKIGYRYNGKVIESLRDGRKTADSSSVAKAAEGLDTGKAGLSWSGSVRSFVFQVSITGRLDPDWVAEQLGEKGQPGEKPGKKSGKKG